MLKKTSKRPYSIEYGLTKGHVATPHRAILSAGRYMDLNGIRHVVVEQPHGPPVDIWLSGAWGFQVVPRKGKK